MSFITKRERVFNDYDLLDLPARNEGKLKAYASCTDARAWSHFCSDKTEHLVEIIKRNNEKCRPKIIPTEVIVNTLMVAKNTEIARLKRKIEEFEQLLTAYDALELTAEQKSEIANAHASIKAANKELDDLYLDLDLSGYTEGIDSEAFETGKSRGDEGSRSLTETTKSAKSEVSKPGGDEFQWSFEREPLNSEMRCSQSKRPINIDVETYCCDPQIDEMKRTIIMKDAKLNAMQNTIAVLENDVCEPYCIYAQIYTALEKIFGILCQNDKYKQYLELLTLGQDTRHIHIKGKILYKIKILEKFCLALIAPCNQEFKNSPQECSCYHSEIVAHVETTFAITAAENRQMLLDNKRTQLIADIIDIEEMKDILNKDSVYKSEDENNECLDFDYNIDKENINRLTNLQSNYNDLVSCYEKLESEKNNLYIRCQNLLKLESECECMKNKLKEYNQLWSEKEYFRKRSEDLDKLKETYYILTEETSNLELKLKAELEINKIKTSTITGLQNENILLEKKLNESSMLFEKERNTIMCKLKECECSIMCKEQQIKSLNCQIEKLLQHSDNVSDKECETKHTDLLNEITTLKEQITKITDAYLSSEDEKLFFQKEFEQKLELINELQFDVDSWRSKYEENVKANDFLNAQMNLLLNENQTLSQNLHDIIKNKCQEIKNLTDELESKKKINSELLSEIQKSRQDVTSSLVLLEKESNTTVTDRLEKSSDKSKTGIQKNIEDVSNTSKDLRYSINDHEDIINEVKLLREESIITINKANDIKDYYKNSLELTKKESLNLQDELIQYKDMTLSFEEIKDKEQETYKKLLLEKNNLENSIVEQRNEIDKLNSLIKQYKIMQTDKEVELECLKENYEKLYSTYELLLTENNNFILNFKNLNQNIKNLTLNNDKQTMENEKLQEQLDSKISDLECKICENSALLLQIENLNQNDKILTNTILSLQNEMLTLRENLENCNKKNIEMDNKLQYYKDVETERDRFKFENEELTKLQYDFANYFKQLENNNEMKLLDKQELKKDSTDEFLTLGSTNPFYTNLKAEIDNIKEEKLFNEHKISSLEEKLNVSDQQIMNLNEDISSRDNTISELQNHINALQCEILNLHTNLEKAIESGEDISRESSLKFGKSIQNIEAHYSRATHNMQAELAKLEENKNDLIDQLFKTKRNHDELDLNIPKYLSQINKFQDEREKIILYLKQLEQNIVGYSNLSQDCTLENILIAMDHINKIFEEKNTLLERTLLDVRNSYGILKTKAEEAKNIAEKEKEKKSYEKEIIEKERIDKEKQIENLQVHLKSQETQYEKMLEDLEAKLLNQELLFKKIIESKEVHINKLKDEIQSLKDICEKSQVMNKTLQEKLERSKHLKIENNKQTELLHDMRKAFEEKSIEIQHLQKILNEKNNTISKDVMIQTECAENLDFCMQTTDESDSINPPPNNKFIEQTNASNINLISHNNARAIRDNNSDVKLSLPNEVQIMTAKIEPSFDFIKNIYQNYKINRLQTKHLEQCSFYSIVENINDSNDSFNNIIENIQRNLSESVTKHIHSDQSTEKLDFCDNEVSETRYNNGTSSKLKLDKSEENLRESTPMKFVDKDFTNYSGQHQIKSISLEALVFEHKERTIQKKYNTVENKIYLQNEESVNNSEINKMRNSHHNDVLFNHEKKDLSYIQKHNNKTDNNKISINIKLQDQPNILTSTDIEFDKNIRKTENAQNNNNENRKNMYPKPKLMINLPRINSFTDKSENNVKTYHSKDFYASSHSLTNLSINSSIKDNNSNGSVQKSLTELNIDQNSNKNQSLTLSQKHLDKHRNNIDKSVHDVIKPKISIAVSQLGLSNIDGYNPSIENTCSVNPVSPKVFHNDEYPSKVFKDDKKVLLEPIFYSTNVIRKSISCDQLSKISSIFNRESLIKSPSVGVTHSKVYKNQSVWVKIDSIENYQRKIEDLSNALQIAENEYKKKIEAVKVQYENNVKSILKEHNQGVKNIQSLHEETLGDIIKMHDTEIENLRSMSISAMRQVEKLKKENLALKFKRDQRQNLVDLDEKPTKLTMPEQKKQKSKRPTTSMLTKTEVEAFNVKPKKNVLGPCTCSLDINISDTLRTIFEQVDVDQRKMAEETYLKYIASKLVKNNIESLNAQELSFLHLKVCNCWKTKLTKEETLKLKIDSLEKELITKQRKNQLHISELDRKLTEERQRLQEVRKVICKNSPAQSRDLSPIPFSVLTVTDNECIDYGCVSMAIKNIIDKRKCPAAESACSGCADRVEQIRKPTESHRAVLAQLDQEEYKGKKCCHEETPTRLRKSLDRCHRPSKK